MPTTTITPCRSQRRQFTACVLADSIVRDVSVSTNSEQLLPHGVSGTNDKLGRFDIIRACARCYTRWDVCHLMTTAFSALGDQRHKLSRSRCLARVRSRHRSNIVDAQQISIDPDKVAIPIAWISAHALPGEVGGYTKPGFLTQHQHIATTMKPGITQLSHSNR